MHCVRWYHRTHVREHHDKQGDLRTQVTQAIESLKTALGRVRSGSRWKRAPPNQGDKAGYQRARWPVGDRDRYRGAGAATHFTTRLIGLEQDMNHLSAFHPPRKRLGLMRDDLFGSTPAVHRDTLDRLRPAG